jgi:putative MATE family efflux protein
MIIGVLGMVAFNLTDTYFVGRLGTFQIAALSFTFPVVMVVNSINMGIGIGASAVISHAAGEKKKEKVVRLATDSLTLGLLISIVMMTVGLLSIKSLFLMLGAENATLPYIQEYMRIWYIGVPFVVIPMIGNNAIRALGDTKTPSIVMLVSAVINMVLDPLIFGIGIFPEMQVAGAALATVIARAFTLVFSLYILIIREKVISLKKIHIRSVLQSWKAILFIGLPNAIAKMIVPLGAGIITSLIAVYGVEAVAGYGIATKIEFFALSIMRALIAVFPVFVGQNFGAKKVDRIEKAIVAGEKFSILNGIGLYVLLIFLARPIAQVFTNDVDVINTSVLYFRIVPLGYIFMSIVQIVNGTFNALKKPIKAASVNLIQMLVIYLPLALLTSKYFGITAIFMSLVVSYAIVGIVGNRVLKNDLNKLKFLIKE